jgi:anthranilate synthase component 2
MTEPSAPEAGSGSSGGLVAADATAVDHVGEMTVLVVDNYDSFVYNLVQYVGEVVTSPGPATRSQDIGEVVTTTDWLPEVTDGEVVVRRNDATDVAGIRALEPDAIVVSPGPGTPRDAGVSMPLFRELEYPTLGVCLGHQALCAVNEAAVGHAEAVVHGKQSTVSHDGCGVFASLPDGFRVGRYHSLAVERADLPEILEETAHTDDEAGVVMGVRHRERPHVGVQFHPESFLTEHGKQMIATFCRLALEGSL